MISRVLGPFPGRVVRVHGVVLGVEAREVVVPGIAPGKGGRRVVVQNKLLAVGYWGAGLIFTEIHNNVPALRRTGDEGA